uniref:Rab11 family-interacting protein 5-like n=1 Tax=Paramormyrops kingsleyae TaxID=1676925 RepID=A0A3B3QWN5_9TELE|nr:rab11 family-interacting protein 5-like isoform X1 [Paramormyrops kingsleyae]
MSINEELRWLPTHVQVTVLRARGLRAKGKHGTSDSYSIIQLGKEKFSTCVVEKSTSPEWKEECTFELLPGVLDTDGRSGDLIVTVMHRALMGLDVFLGQAVIALNKVFQDGICLRNQWYKLHSKSGKKEKDRGEVQVTVQFTRSNLTASMYDLSAKHKPRSPFDKLKDRMKGKKRGDMESSSAIVPGGFQILPHIRKRLPSDGGGEEEYEDDEGGEGRRSKMRNFFLGGKLRKSSDTRSSTSLGSESSESSSRGGSLSPTAGISVVVSDISNSPSSSSNLTADISPEHAVSPLPELMGHKRAFSDETSQITIVMSQPITKCQSGLRSQSSLCINGSHVYAADSLVSGGPGTQATSLELLQKCMPLSRSLQNLTRRSEDPQNVCTSEGRHWSFDKSAIEEKVPMFGKADKDQSESRPVQVAIPMISAVGESAGNGTKHKNNLPQGGEDSDRTKACKDQGVPPEQKHKGWFGFKDPQSRPSPHPVKPLTTTAAQEERRSDSRSVLTSGLEKLKSTIQAGRNTQHGQPEAERSKQSLSEEGTPHCHLSNSDLISLLLQQEAELKKQAAELERKGALLKCRELELKKMKLTVRDLEDYIDKLLVRIMEQTPTLLQVRSKFK